MMAPRGIPDESSGGDAGGGIDGDGGGGGGGDNGGGGHGGDEGGIDGGEGGREGGGEGGALLLVTATLTSSAVMATDCPVAAVMAALIAV